MEWNDNARCWLLDELPRDSYQLIKYLDKAYPPRCIGVGESVESAQRYAGMRELVDHLVNMMEQNEEIIREASLGEADQLPKVLTQRESK